MYDGHDIGLFSGIFVFKEEIEKIKTIPVSEEELKNAVNNLIGKQQYVTETNGQQANMMAYYSIMGKPFDYQAEIIEKLHKVTPKICWIAPINTSQMIIFFRLLNRRRGYENCRKPH
mgnify:CR=1 FL=1